MNELLSMLFFRAQALWAWSSDSCIQHVSPSILRKSSLGSVFQNSQGYFTVPCFQLSYCKLRIHQFYFSFQWHLANPSPFSFRRRQLLWLSCSPFSTYCAFLCDLLVERKKCIFHLWGHFIIRKQSTKEGYIVTPVLQHHLLCFLGMT